ncbi:thioredoxin domain-containing protein [Niallia sp. NCCP-28]|uniref:DsbA family protein n=1 Tax=Niallia sp. NCCP-28 TaxID=2934712 RepID=UPI00207F55C6|nr:thioredoxin domain-containing protein [Niallia sp. NCCP-28]GKU82657.1 disulfide bond formation protein D [Niallia sp. NCCP-28]
MAKKPKKTAAKKQSSKFLYWMIGLVAVCIIGLVILANQPKDGFDFDYKDQPFLGEEAADVSIVEFGDYKCPVCKSFNQSFFPLIEKDFINTGKAKFYYMNYPFIHPVDSTRAAVFAEAVYAELGNDTFWKFHKLLYEKQPDDTSKENVELNTEEFLTDTLKEVTSKENAEKVASVYKEDDYQTRIDKDLSYVETLNITGTPTIYVNGVKFEGKTYEEFQEMVNKAAK